MSSGVEIEVDHDRCAGTAMCTAFAPEVFGLDGGGQATVLDAGASDDATIVDAARQCPMEAITVRDATTGEQHVP